MATQFVLPDVLNSQRINAANTTCRFTSRFLYQKFAPAVGADLARDRSGLISPVTDLQDFGATNRLRSAHFFASFGLGLYDTAFSCPYTIRTSASAYFSKDSPSTKLKYDARAAI